LLAALLSTVRVARADRVFFAPGEVGLAFDGEVSRPVGDPVARSMLASAVSELLSQEEIRDLPSNRPRIVRHEHDGVDYVIELVRQGTGIGVGVRRAKTTLRREGASESPRDLPPRREEAAIPMPRPEQPRPGSKRLRAVREKRTVRVELDDDGVPLDATAIDVDVLPGEVGRIARRTSKPFKRPAVPPVQPSERVYETRIIPRAGRPTTDAEIKGAPAGAHVTFLIAPGGFTLVSERDGSVVVGAIDYAPISGELYLAPWMTLRIDQGAKESVVTFYRHRAAP